jgi:integrase
MKPKEREQPSASEPALSARKIRRKGTGSPEWRNGHWWVKVSLPDGTRPRFRLCVTECKCKTMSEAYRLERCAAVSELARERAAKELQEQGTHIGPKLTILQFGEQWTGGKLNKRWPDHVKRKRTSNQDGQRLHRYVYPHVGNVSVADFRLEDAERVMAKLPTGLSSATRRHVSQLMHRLMEMAVYPARLRQSNPLPKGFMPKVRLTKAFAYLYPEEDAALLKCVDVDLGERLFFGFLSREGMREGEALSLTWEDIDLARGTVRLDVNKTDDPRTWALGEDCAEALRRWWARSGAQPEDLVFNVGGEHLAERLRRSLKTAKVDRRELHDRTPTRQPLRVHDLRATFVTLALAMGRSETWVADRTGHKSSVMINRYRRAARTAAELGLGWLVPLYDAIPELANLANVRTLNTAG